MHHYHNHNSLLVVGIADAHLAKNDSPILISLSQR